MLHSQESRMIGGKEFLEQSKVDVAACWLLYKAGDYGNAAYHLQQAVEKYTKACLLYGNLLTGSKTHLPLSKFINELLPAFHSLDKIVKSHSGIIVKEVTQESRESQFLVQSQVMISKLAKKDQTCKKALWKNSLGIPLLIKEEEIFQQCPIFRKYYKVNLTKAMVFPGNTRASDNFWNQASTDPEMKKLYFYQPIAELGSMIAATFPHEDFGRYPTEIETTNGIENSADLYRQHTEELKKLIETAERYLKPSRKIQMITV